MIPNTSSRRRAAAAAAWALPALLLCGVAGQAQASVIFETAIVGPVSLDDPGVYPTNEVLGTFSYKMPHWDTLIGATVSGQWGTSYLTPDTAAGVYSVGGVPVFTCHLGDDCWGSDAQTSWSFTFTPGELSSLTSGAATFAAVQSSFGQVQADVTTLTLTFNVPEPSTVAVFGAALLGMGLLVRRSRA